MEAFDRLVEVADRLLGPNGCPWDHTQTFETLQQYVLEEAHEVIEAVDQGDDKKILEELGDLLYTVIFYAKIAEKTNRFTLRDILENIAEKLIRRHPHVFGGVTVRHVDNIIQNWEAIKKQEKKDAPAQGLLESMPASLPTLVKAQKLVRKLARAGSLKNAQGNALWTEDTVGKALLELVISAETQGIDAESALRRTLKTLI